MAGFVQSTNDETTCFDSRGKIQDKKWRLLAFCQDYVGFLIVGIVFLTYLPATTFDYIGYDDTFYASENPNIAAGFTKASLEWALTDLTWFYHPVTWLSFLTDVEMHGRSAAVHHTTNIWLHALTTVLLFALLRRTFLSLPMAALVSLIFALHPQRAESVVWISERKDVLAGFFWLCSLLSYCSFLKNGLRRWYFVTLAAFALSLLSKPAYVLGPLMFLLLDLWAKRLRDPVTFGRNCLEKIPFLTASLFIGFLTLFTQRMADSTASLAALGFGARLMRMAAAFWHYVSTLVYPHSLRIFYTPSPKDLPGEAILGLCALAGVLLIAYKSRTLVKPILCALTWFWLTLLPVSGVCQSGGQAYADRYSYLSSIALLVPIGIIADRAVAQRGRVPTLVAGCALLVVLSEWLCLQNYMGHWRNAKTLFSYVVSVDPHNPVGETMLGLVAAEKRDWKTAKYHFGDVIEHHPTYTLAAFRLRYIRYLEKGGL